MSRFLSQSLNNLEWHGEAVKDAACFIAEKALQSPNGFFSDEIQYITIKNGQKVVPVAFQLLKKAGAIRPTERTKVSKKHRSRISQWKTSNKAILLHFIK